MDLALKDLGDYITGQLPKDVTSFDLSLGELCLNARAEGIVRVLTLLRDDVNCRFKQLVDVCGVDYPEREPRFDVVYNLLSLTNNNRIRVKVQTDEDTPVPTVTGVYSAANWWEREAWDMYGKEIRYDGEKKRVVYEPVKLTQEFRSFDFLSPWEGVQTLLPGDEKAELQEDEDPAKTEEGA
jgi:NADH-quinone oxidoreductase subunit C